MTWETLRRRPTGRAALAGAQLAYARYAQDVAERSPLLRSRWLRMGLPALYGFLAAGYAAIAIGQVQQRLYDCLIAASSR